MYARFKLRSTGLSSEISFLDSPRDGHRSTFEAGEQIRRINRINHLVTSFIKPKVSRASSRKSCSMENQEWNPRRDASGSWAHRKEGTSYSRAYPRVANSKILIMKVIEAEATGALEVFLYTCQASEDLSLRREYSGAWQFEGCTSCYNLTRKAK